MNKRQGTVLNIDIKRGYGMVAAGVAGVVLADAVEPLRVAVTERDLGMNRKARRAARQRAKK